MTVQILSRETEQLLTDFNEQLLKDALITEEAFDAALEQNRNGEGTDEWNARSASGESYRDARKTLEAAQENDQSPDEDRESKD